jgi:hypothetical protein
MPKSNEPKRHHYLSEFYLRGFCIENENSLCVYNKSENKFYFSNIEDVAVEKKYYTYINSDGNKTVGFEKALAEIESDTKPVFDKLISKQGISADEKSKISLYIAFISSAVPGSREKLKNKFKDIFSKFASESDLLSLTVKLTQEKTNDFIPNSWVIGHAPNNTSFITSDNPLLVYKSRTPQIITFLKKPIKESSKIPMQANLFIMARNIFPLTRTACLVTLGSGNDIIHTEIAEAAVESINLHLIRNMLNYAYAQDEDLLKSLVRNMKTKL